MTLWDAKRMYRFSRNFPISVFLISSLRLFAQPTPTVVWIQNLSVGSDNVAWDVTTGNGTALVVGAITANDGEVPTALFAMLNSIGDTIWTSNARIESLSFAERIHPYTNSRYIITGSLLDTLSRQHLAIWNVYDDGSIGGMDAPALPDCVDIANSCLTLAGQLLCVGEQDSETGWGDQAFVTLLSVEGELIWTRQYEQSFPTQSKLLSCAKMSSGNCIVVGELLTLYPPPHALDKDIIMMAIDPQLDGDTVWTRIFGSSQFNETPINVLQLGDSSLLIVGGVEDTNTNQSSVYIVRTDEMGQASETLTVNIPNLLSIRSSAILHNGDIVICGSVADSFTDRPLAFTAELSMDGIVGWFWVLDSENTTEAVSLASFNELCLVAGNAMSSEGDTNRAFLALLDPTTTVSSSDGIRELNNTLLVYPNPCNGNVNLITTFLNNSSGEIRVYNVLGQVVFTSLLQHQERFATIPVQEWTSGKYFVEIGTRAEVVRKPFVVVK